MKSFYIVLLAVVALLTGCDSVGSDERLIEIPAATVQRNVLVAVSYTHLTLPTILLV